MNKFKKLCYFSNLHRSIEYINQEGRGRAPKPFGEVEYGALEELSLWFLLMLLLLILFSLLILIHQLTQIFLKYAKPYKELFRFKNFFNVLVFSKNISKFN